MTAIETISKQLQGNVKDVMSIKVHTATVGTHVNIVADLMARYSLRRVVVVDNAKQVIGVVSQRDIVRALMSSMKPEGQEVVHKRVEQLITVEKPITVGPDIPLARAAYVLATNKIGCLPVVDEHHTLVGVLSISDIIQFLADDNVEGMETAFQMYSPRNDAKTRSPAYVRKMNGDLVIPLKNIENKRARMDYAVLGYDPPTGRILIKFVRATADEAIATKVQDDNLIIPAKGFVRHFSLIGKVAAFDVTDHNQSKFLVLSPKNASSGSVNAVGTT
ncbi:inosine 5'-monophosphate dehydrogenase [Bremerella volcania]|uniref:Inosine 5'-monophosphate dehydrogenase n=1 Tax=Bremerella volcania TaxID=2527984 RepID=A0A518C461_9BACT|nr:CBS domain-containing protein [Bremerella volcania]QDU74010.1 inosine 5'-monophosphate dehydrogenase [Bremerella volcania]